MCKYLITKKAKLEIEDHELVATAETSNDAFDRAEKIVLEDGVDAYVFERVSVGRTARSVQWEGKRRPGVG